MWSLTQNERKTGFSRIQSSFFCLFFGLCAYTGQPISRRWISQFFFCSTHSIYCIKYLYYYKHYRRIKGKKIKVCNIWLLTKLPVDLNKKFVMKSNYEQSRKNFTLFIFLFFQKNATKIAKTGILLAYENILTWIWIILLNYHENISSLSMWHI